MTEMSRAEPRRTPPIALLARRRARGFGAAGRSKPTGRRLGRSQWQRTGLSSDCGVTERCLARKTVSEVTVGFIRAVAARHQRRDGVTGAANSVTTSRRIGL